jgi:pSer/pThr/pTyr-binding forkhead associated (FHA) protein
MAPLLADQDAVAETPTPPAAREYDDFDSGATSLLQPDARADADSTVLEGPPGEDLDRSGTRDRDDWHEAPTGSFAVPPLPPSPPQPEDELDDDELSGATRILSRPRLVEIENGSSGREHPLALGRTSIGRASDNLVHLLDEAVSRHHAEVVPGPQGYLLRDLGSENGIFVNGDRTPEHVLREGDVVQIGARTLVFHGA